MKLVHIKMYCLDEFACNEQGCESNQLKRKGIGSLLEESTHDRKRQMQGCIAYFEFIANNQQIFDELSGKDDCFEGVSRILDHSCTKIKDTFKGFAMIANIGPSILIGLALYLIHLNQ
jgi:hypothetical protein